MRVLSRLSVSLIGLAAVVALAGCGADAPTTPTRTVTATLTESQIPEPSAPATSDAAPRQPVADTPDDEAAQDEQAPPPRACGPRVLDPATIAAAISRLTHTGFTWHVIGSNFSTCNNISYVAVDTVGTATPAPYQLMLFDKAGTFLGTGIKCDVLYQQVVDSGPDFVVARYNYDGPGQAMGSQTGSAYAMYTWDGSRVVMVGKLPIEVTYKNC